MVKIISPTIPAGGLSGQRRGFNHSARNTPTAPLEGEPLEGELLGEVLEETAPASPRFYYERRRGSDRRQRHTVKPYLDVRCRKDRRHQHSSGIDIEI